MGTPTANAFQGVSVAISADGITAIVGAPGDSGGAGTVGQECGSGIGAAFIYLHTTGGWLPQGRLVGTGGVGNGSQGCSVALSDDGSTAAIGGPGDNGSIGAVWIFKRNTANVWVQQGNKIVGTGATGASLQGRSVALSPDGNTLVVGGPGDNSSLGAVWIFNFSGGVWNQIAKLTGTGSLGNPTAAPFQGASTALSGDGNTVAIGGPFDNRIVQMNGSQIANGAVWIFTQTAPGVWTQQTKITPPGFLLSPPFFGNSVSLSGTGDYALIGGFGDVSGIGAAWVYLRTSGTWALQQKLTANDSTILARQGAGVSISRIGDKAVVGGNGNNGGQGAAWVYTRSGTSWTQSGSSLTGSGNTGPASQGTSVALAATAADTFIEGGYLNSGNIGAAWAFGTSTSLGVKVSTTTSLTSSLNPSTSGQSVTLTAAVANTGGVPGTPTGTVTFTIFDGSSTITTSPPLDPSGVATFSANFVAGSYIITATYNGDTTFATSTSSSITQVVKQIQTITVTQPASQPYGSSFTVAPTATSGLPVSISASGGCSNGSGSSTIMMTSSTTSCTVTYSVGSNATYGPATQTVITTATKADTALSTPVGSGTLVVGQTITISTILSVLPPGAGTPSGTITFTNGATVIGTATVTGGGMYQISYTLVATTGTIVATYGGDANFNGSTASFDLTNVGKAPTTTAVSSSLNPSLPGQAVTFTATVTSAAAGLITGFVTFMDGTTALGTVPLNGSAQASFTTSTLAAGSHTVTALYSGDPTFASSTGTLAPAQVVKFATTLSTPIGAGTLVVGQTITLSTTLSIPAGGTPAGTITFTNGATVIGTATVSGAGTYTINYTLISTTGSIVATYSGDGNFQGATSPAFNLANVKLPTTTGLTGPIAAQVNQNTTYTATVSLAAGSGVTPGGTVSFTLNGSAVPGCQTLALTGGAASCNISFSATGTQTVGATYSGDANTAGSSASLQVLIGGSGQAASPLVLTITSSAPGPTVGQPVTFTATITGGSDPPQGTVQLFEGTTLLGSGTVRNGQATISVPSLSAGSHNILAVFTNTNGPNILTVFGQYVYALPTKLALTVTPSPSVFGQTITLTAQLTFTGPTGILPPTGSISFFDGATLLGSIAVGPAIPSIQVSQLAAGTHQLTAMYSGDATWNISISSVVVQIVNPAATTTVPSALPDYSGATPQVTVTAKVTVVSPGGGVPTGTVQFVDADSGAIFGTGTLDAGTATIKLADRLTAPHTIRATFSGSPNYQGSTGMAPVLQLVNAAAYSFPMVTSNEIVTIFGSGLADAVAMATLPLMEKLGGSTVSVKDAAGIDHPALLFYASPGQINLLVPANLGAGIVTITVTTSAGRAFSIITRVAPVVPGLFSADATGRGIAAAQVIRVAADGTHTDSTAATMGSGGQPVPVPIDLSDSASKFYVALYGTGLRAGRNVTATVNGIAVPVLFSGAQPSFTGLDQVNLGPLPVSLQNAGMVDVQIMVDGQPSNTVSLMFR